MASIPKQIEYLYGQLKCLKDKISAWENYGGEETNLTFNFETNELTSTYVDGSSRTVTLQYGAQNLQQVLDEGNTAQDAPIVLTSSADTSTLLTSSNYLKIYNPISKSLNRRVSLLNGTGLEFTYLDYAIEPTPSTYRSIVIGTSNIPTSGANTKHILELPFKSGTIATLDDISTNIIATLQSVIDEDGYAHTDTENSYIQIDLSSDSNGYFDSYFGDEYNNYGELYIDVNGGGVFSEGSSSKGRVAISNGIVELAQYNNTNFFQTRVNFESAIANSTLLFPAKANGVYTLATLDDIAGGGSTPNLQQVLDTGNLATSVDNKSSILFDIENEDISFNVGTNNPTPSDSGTGVTFKKNSAGLFSLGAVSSAIIVDVNYGVVITNMVSPSESTSVEFTTPTSKSIIKFPAKATAGTYTLATLDDITSGGTSATGLEALDEGNGIGWRLIGKDPAAYGNIGLNAVDLSYYNGTSSSTGATGISSFTAGGVGQASGTHSMAFSTTNVFSWMPIASGTNSIAMGVSSFASGSNAFSIGLYSSGSAAASGLCSFALNTRGFTSASGAYSIAIGYDVSAPSHAEIALGRLGTIYTPNYALGYNSNDRAFSVGIGDDTIGSGNKGRVDGIILLKSGLFTLPALTISMINSESSGRVAITKEYANNSYTKIVTTVTAPTSSTDIGTKGEVRIIGGDKYECIATNTWVKSTVITSF